ncbi:MAG: DUF996 domain-containing protein, partial [Candidatus Bathyarchaeota archaeon]|nr:DUF996 domain-containing protein [Candidatus Bathyarchaeota archaeon]
MELETSKNLGGIGAILLVIGFLGFIGSAFSGILSLVGLILVLIAMKGLSDHYGEASIFNNSLYGVILLIVGGVVSVAALIVTALSLIKDVLGIELSTAISDPTAFSRIDWTEVVTENLIAYAGTMVGILIVLFIFVVVAAIFYRKSLNTLSSKSGVGMFSTAGLVLLIGAVLTIILIGVIIIWIALILLAVAFFRIKPAITQPTPSTSPPPSG